MRPKEGIVLKAFAERYHPGADLLRFLTPEEQGSLQQVPKPESVQFGSSIDIEKWIQFIHYSWFVHALEKLPKENADFLCSLFPFDDDKRLRLALKLPQERRTSSGFIKPFFLNGLKKQVEDNTVYPYEQLPHSEMNAILRLNHKQLIHMIDLLGIYDLAAELRQIVDRALLGRIYSALSQEQLQFLHYCTKQSMKWVPPPLGITHWDGNKKAFNNLLHQRGLIRLARGVLSEEYSLRWYLTHKLDQARGRALEKLFSVKQEPSMTVFFKNQVLHLIKRYAVV